MATNLDALPVDLTSQHLAIVGKTGSGKTYTAKRFVERLLDAKRRVCILDPTGVWYGLRSSVDGKRAGYPVAVFGGQHADVPIAAQSGAAVARIVATKNLPAIVDLSEMLIGDRHRFVTDFAESLYRDNREPLHLVIDEADEFSPQNPLPETKRMLHHVDRIVRRGRVRGFRVMMITQRPAVLHKNVLTQCNALIAMRLTAPQDRKALQAWVEGQADAGQAKEVLNSLAQLKRGEGWVWAPEHSYLQRTQFPAIVTFDSGRTPDDTTSATEPTHLAAVDLGEIRSQFEEVQQDLRAVPELKAEIDSLKRKLAASEKVKGCAPEAEVQRRIREAVAASPTKGSGLTETALRQELESVTRSKNALELVLKGWHDRARKMAASLLEHVGDVAVGTKATEPLRAAVARNAVRAPAEPDVAQGPAPTSPGLSGPQQRILDVLAQLNALGVAAPPRSVVAVFADASPTSSSYGNNLGRLRTLGLIDYPAGGRVALSTDGRHKANAPTGAATLADLHEGWCRQVSGPQAAILRALIAAFPDPIDREHLAANVGASGTSSSYGNNLGHLRTLGAIDYPSRGMVRATDLLFPEGMRRG